MSTCKKKIKKVFKFNQIIFIIQYRNFQYRDVQYRVPRCLVCSVPRCPDTEEPPPTLVRLVKELILMLLMKIN